MESLVETRAKLIQRRKDVAIRTRGEVPSVPVQSKLIEKRSASSLCGSL